jgi:hypothetical protein
VLKRASRKNDEDRVPDVPADNPEGTMDRFTAGLKKVLGAHKPTLTKPPPKRKAR